MKSEWVNCTVQDLINNGLLDEPLDGNHGDIHPKSTDYVDTGIPFIMASDLINGCIDFLNCKYITETQASTLRKGFAKPGDVLLTHKATLGRTAIVDDTHECVVLTPQVTYYRTKAGLNNKYLKYYFDSAEFQTTLFNWAASGSTRSYLGITAQRGLPVIVPPLKEQEIIADTLSAFDDKIVNNTEINCHLEQMAQAIFKSWFVDFEPFDGVMPDDWKDGTLSEIANITMGQSPDGKSYNEDGVGTVFYQGRAEFGLRFPTRRLYTTQPKRMAAKGDVLMSVRAPVGDINIAYEPCCLGRGLAGIHSINDCQSFTLYTMFALKQELEMYNGEGTVFGSINKDAMANLPLLIPSDNIMRQFNDLVSPIDAAIETSYREVRHLQTIRDALLPRLMSGELTV